MIKVLVVTTLIYAVNIKPFNDCRDIEVIGIARTGSEAIERPKP